MQAGRIFKQNAVKAAEDKKIKEITAQVNKDNPDLKDKALEKEVQTRIRKEKEQAELADAVTEVTKAREAYEKSMYDYASLKVRIDSKSGVKTR